MENLGPLFKIAEIIAKEKSGSISDTENKVLQDWLAENDRNKEICTRLRNGKKLVHELNELKKFDSTAAFHKVEKKIDRENKPFSIYRSFPNYLKYAAAIAVLAISSYIIITQLHKSEPGPYAQHTFRPGRQKAILVTAGNRQIELDSSANKHSIKDETAGIVQSGSTLFYSKTDSISKINAPEKYNTLITPRGGEYSLVLSDGTMVMLNSDSRLKFPVNFRGNVREVVLEGEAFFKVAKSDKIPFVVNAGKVNVTVYGTQFNVSAYNNENLVQTTLVEGSVGVSTNTSNPVNTKINPGQQFNYDKATDSSETREVNTDQFTAWTRGMFVFENEPIGNIFKAMSRWYNFDFEFKDETIKNQRFSLSLDRYGNVSKILELMSMSSNVKFSVNGNKITIYTE